MKITFPMLLGLLFIGLKLGHAIAWSWWWVLLPLYGPLAIVLLALGLVLAVCVFAGVASVVQNANARSAADRWRDSLAGIGRLRTK